MCTHYRPPDAVSLAQVRAWAETAEARGWTPHDDAWPKAEMPVVFQAPRRTLGVMRWGVWPHYEKSLPARPQVNARDDALLVKPIWRDAAAHGRCLVPARGFFEWCGPARGRWEVLFELPEKKPFFFAGLWTRDPVGEGRGFALVTGQPNELVAALPHDRMPVILTGAAAAAWLGDRPLPPEKLQALCAPLPAARLTRTDQPRAARTDAALATERVTPGELFDGLR